MNSALWLSEAHPYKAQTSLMSHELSSAAMLNIHSGFLLRCQITLKS